MSGGVDSSVAALLLKRQGFEVTGLTVETWEEGDGFEETGDSHDIRLAKAAAEAIGIQHRTINLKKEFKEQVVDNFLREYERGRTPNPCIMCNPTVKWEGLLRTAEELQADCVATGHYARVDRLSNGRLAIKNSASAAKDQTYVLWRLSQEQLKKTVFPVGDLEKAEVRRIAEEAGLPAAHIADSQEICFFSGTDYALFLSRQGIPSEPGDFVDKDGKVLGTHKGLIHYTIGQRKGLGISFGHPVFVTGLHPEQNEVVLGESGDLFAEVVHASDVHLMGAMPFEEGAFTAKIRYAKKAAPCRIRMTEKGELTAFFEEPQRAPTPGQSIVFYDGDYVAGGGVIEKSEKRA